MIWHLGFPLVHTAVYIPALSADFSFGGHEHPNVTGVYSAPPCTPPPGARLRRVLRLGVAKCSPAEAAKIIAELGREYPGDGYHLLTRNCNHFTDAVLRRLLRRGLPRWCNRAAALGRAFPCLIPEEWTPGPEVKGRLVDEDEWCDERTGMLGVPGARTDVEGRPLPPSETVTLEE